MLTLEAALHCCSTASATTPVSTALLVFAIALDRFAKWTLVQFVCFFLFFRDEISSNSRILRASACAGNMRRSRV
jgi:hypothetical protein